MNEFVLPELPDDLELTEDEIITADTIAELSNNKGDDDDE